MYSLIYLYTLDNVVHGYTHNTHSMHHDINVFIVVSYTVNQDMMLTLEISDDSSQEEEGGATASYEPWSHLRDIKNYIGYNPVRVKVT